MNKRVHHTKISRVFQDKGKKNANFTKHRAAPKSRVKAKIQTSPA